MRKINLICCGLRLLFVGIKIEILKKILRIRTEKRITKKKEISDFISVRLTVKISELLSEWEEYEQIMKKLFTEISSAQ